MLRTVIFGICVLLTALVFAAMFVAIWRSRHSSDATAHFHHSAAVEVVWALIPCLMFLAGVIPAAGQIVTVVSAH